MVWSLAESRVPFADGGGELPGAGSAGDGHACLPCAPVRAINDDPVVTSEGGLLAQRTRRRCDTCVETLVQQARAQITIGTHGHAFLELCCSSDSELAAVVVEHSVVIRVTSFDDFQLNSTRPALDRLLMICKAYDVVVDIWVSIPCTAGTPFRRINEKCGAETGDLAMTYKSVVAAVGLCRHTVGIADGFSWKWSNGNELWKLVVVRNFFARCGSSSCLVSTAAVGQQYVDCEEARLTQYGLSDHNAAKHRWCYFPKMQMDEVLLFQQFETDTSLPGRMTFHTAFVDPTARPDVPKRQSIECSAFLFFREFESNIFPALPSNAVAKEVASHAERGTWDLSLVRELSEWMRDDAFSEVLVGRVSVTLGVKFAERLLIGMQRPLTTTAVDDSTVPTHAEGRVEKLWKFSAFRAA